MREAKIRTEYFFFVYTYGAGYFDYYLLHALMRSNYDKYEEYHLWDFVKELKEVGGYGGKEGKKGFDTILTRLQMQCFIVTTDFVFQEDKHGNRRSPTNGSSSTSGRSCRRPQRNRSKRCWDRLRKERRTL